MLKQHHISRMHQPEGHERCSRLFQYGHTCVRQMSENSIATIAHAVATCTAQTYCLMSVP